MEGSTCSSEAVGLVLTVRRPADGCGGAEIVT